MYPLYPRAHLLAIPRETRDIVYAKILKSIHAERHVCEGNPVSGYDGLRLSCTQLHDETQKSVFCFGYTSRQLTKLLNFKIDRTNFLSVRSVSIEIPFNLIPAVSQGIAAFFHQAQLSLQELHIFFVGEDRHGNYTNMHGCGKKNHFPSSGNEVGLVPLLLEEGQDFGHQWTLIRQTALLRNLQVFQIENANLPVSASLLYNNKPHLRCLSVTSDQRSVPSSLSRIKPSQVLQLYSNIGIKVTSFPPLRVLSLSANSAPDAEGIVSGVSQSLRHFSWRVPNPDFQPYRREKCLYSLTNRLVETLSWRAPRLNTLRLCISMRKHETRTEAIRREFGTVTEQISCKLHLFNELKELEIHFCGDQGPGGFFRTQLVGRLPIGLSRLYLSDSAISVTELAEQVRRRYFTYLEDLNETVGLAVSTTTRGQGLSGGRLSSGELRDRHDDIPLTGGNLGFVNFEYSCTETDYSCIDDGNFLKNDGSYVLPGDNESMPSPDHHESERTKMLRINGQLLDRERHLHLAYTQQSSEAYGIPARQQDWSIYTGPIETATYSSHAEINYQLYKELENAPPPHELAVKRNRQDLEECIRCLDREDCKDYKDARDLKYHEDSNYFVDNKDDKDDPVHTHKDRYWDWYFGNETEAELIFWQEPVAKVEDQTQRSDLMDVEICESERERCRWSCPDFEVPPVGSFTEPQIPADWRDHVCERV